MRPFLSSVLRMDSRFLGLARVGEPRACGGAPATTLRGLPLILPLARTTARGVFPSDRGTRDRDDLLSVPGSPGHQFLHACVPQHRVTAEGHLLGIGPPSPETPGS